MVLIYKTLKHPHIHAYTPENIFMNSKNNNVHLIIQIKFEMHEK